MTAFAFKTVINMTISSLSGLTVKDCTRMAVQCKRKYRCTKIAVCRSYYSQLKIGKSSCCVLAYRVLPIEGYIDWFWL